MNALAKKSMTAAAAVMTAGAIAFAPSVQPPPPAPAPTVQLTADVRLAAAFDPFSLTDWLERIVIPPSLGASFPLPPSVSPPSINLSNIDSTVKSIYFAVEPWVRYGFDLAAYVVGFIPYVGWLAPQITIFYNLGESIVRSAIFNTTEWLTGQGTFFQNLGQFGVDTANAFINFANAELGFWLPPLPPIPPIPPIFGQGVVGTQTLALTSTPTVPDPLNVVENKVTVPDTGLVSGNDPGKDQSNPLATLSKIGTDTTDTPKLPNPRINPFNISGSQDGTSTDTATPGGKNPLRDVLHGVTNTVFGPTKPSATISNPLAGLNKIHIPGLDNRGLTRQSADDTPKAKPSD